MRKITLSTIKNDLLAGKDLYEAFGFIFEDDCVYSTTVQYVVDKVFDLSIGELSSLISRYDAFVRLEERGLVSQVLVLCWFERLK